MLSDDADGEDYNERKNVNQEKDVLKEKEVKKLRNKVIFIEERWRVELISVDLLESFIVSLNEECTNS